MKYIYLVFLTTLVFFSSCEQPIDTGSLYIRGHAIHPQTGDSIYVGELDRIYYPFKLDDENDPNNPFNHPGDSLKFKIVWWFGNQDWRMAEGEYGLHLQGMRTYGGESYVRWKFSTTDEPVPTDRIEQSFEFSKGGKDGKLKLGIHELYQAGWSTNGFAFSVEYDILGESISNSGSHGGMGGMTIENHHATNNFGRRMHLEFYPDSLKILTADLNTLWQEIPHVQRIALLENPDSVKVKCYVSPGNKMGPERANKIGAGLLNAMAADIRDHRATIGDIQQKLTLLLCYPEFIVTDSLEIPDEFEYVIEMGTPEPAFQF